ncbi:uncharacterized protein LOC122301716 [Carya illinoinensis]|uniref:uncharacterized protein LOC122301716 n=1 Tax=Carya illinoinensis TaxID=32201 RepID=UPI001C71E88F|nr:uncharacterized protein LOC122301716 [Carya illinoinensis]
MLVANFTTRRILINNGSSADILFYVAFTRMGINIARLQLASTPLKGFSRDMVNPEGTITLLVLTGTVPYSAAIMVDFLVVKALSSYNDAITGRPALNSLQAVTLTYHLKMKFPTLQGIGEVQGEQIENTLASATSLPDKITNIFIPKSL